MDVTVMVLDSQASPHESSRVLLFQPSGKEGLMPPSGRSYRLATATLAIIKLEGQNHPTTVPTGALIKVLGGAMNGNRLVDVEWEDKTVMLFTTDIRERCVPLEEV